MDQLTEVVYDIETKLLQERELTPEEIQLHQDSFVFLIEEKNKAEQAKKSALEKLAAIGLTVEDLAALGL